MIWALIDGNDAGWTSASILGRLAGAVVFLAAFAVSELRQARPMVDFQLFKRSTFLDAVLAMLGYGASAQVMVFFLPQFLQNAYGFGPLAAGVAMLPFAMPMAVGPRLTTYLAARFSGRGLLTAGLAISAVGNLIFWALAGEDLAYPIFMVGMLPWARGCGSPRSGFDQ